MQLPLPAVITWYSLSMLLNRRPLNALSGNISTPHVVHITSTLSNIQILSNSWKSRSSNCKLVSVIPWKWSACRLCTVKTMVFPVPETAVQNRLSKWNQIELVDMMRVDLTATCSIIKQKLTLNSINKPLVSSKMTKTAFGELITCDVCARILETARSYAHFRIQAQTVCLLWYFHSGKK